MRGRDDLLPFSHRRSDALDLACIDVTDGKDAGCARLQSSAPTACGAGEYKLNATTGSGQPIRIRSADEERRVPDTSLPDMFGCQRIISSLPSL